jgi:hypothetical protein
MAGPTNEITRATTATTVSVKALFVNMGTPLRIDLTGRIKITFIIAVLPHRVNEDFFVT